MPHKRPEVLSPVGDAERLLYALDYGADAVYLGAKEFGMRSSSLNFAPEELVLAAQQVHARDKKIYLTLNTIPTNDDMLRLPAFIEMAANTGVDAFIVADLGVLSLVKKHAPHVEIHFSTQAGIANFVAATAAYEMGAKRVVLARELSLQDIACVRKNTPPELELEVFVHGAMCMSVSGRCLISQHLTGRDANKGECPQSCRWRYTLHEEFRPGESYEIGEGEGGSYILSADDLCMAPFIDQVIAAGADSLKIEGRAKSFYYVASVTAAYRKAVDTAVLSLQSGEEFFCPDFALEELQRTSHRPYSTGFFFGKQGATQSPSRSNYIRDWQLIGVVEEQRDGRLYCTQRGKFNLGESLELLLPQGRAVSLMPNEILDKDGKIIEATPHGKMEFSVSSPDVKIPPRSILRKKVIT